MSDNIFVLQESSSEYETSSSEEEVDEGLFRDINVPTYKEEVESQMKGRKTSKSTLIPTKSLGVQFQSWKKRWQNVLHNYLVLYQNTHL